MPRHFSARRSLNWLILRRKRRHWATSLIASREITLTPGQRFENVEKVPKGAAYIAVAALFYAPAPQRWKYVFEVKEVEDTGIVLGAHACAMTVATGKIVLPPGMPAFDPSRLGSLQCPN